MGTPISKADLFALPIPAERVTLRIANAAAVSHNFITAISTVHRLPSLQLHKCTRNNWTVSTYSSIHWPTYNDRSKSKNRPHSSGSKHSPTAGYPLAEFDTASTPTTPILAQVPRAPSRRPSGPSSQDQNSATSGHSYCSGYHRLVPRPQLPNPNSTDTVLQKALPTKTLSAGAACTPTKSPRTSKQCIMLTVPNNNCNLLFSY
jgi:hypothetical protein